MADDRVVRSLASGVPANSLLGNLTPGTGPARPITLQDVAAAVASTGMVASPGAPANLVAIANQRVLGNGSGASAAPVALSITQPAAGLTVAWAAGGITLALANDLAGLEGMAGTGLVTRTAANTYAQRTITGTANKITVTDGDGVAGNPTLTIARSPILIAGQIDLTQTTDETIAAEAGMIVPDYYEIGAGVNLEIGTNAVMEIT